MSVIITFFDGSIWQITNIGFAELVENYTRLFPEDIQMQKELEFIRCFGGIGLREVDPSRARKLLDALEQVAERTVVELSSQGTKLVPTDPQEQQDHLHVIRKLLDSVQRAKSTS